MPTLTVAHLTDTELVRKINQDSVAVLTADELECRLDGLYVVADGMGGKAGGEIASRVSVETVPDVVQEILNEQTEGAGPQALAQALREALEAANDAVYTQARANPELRGMGTTCIAALIRGDQAVIGNVGDSRIYLLRAGRLQQLTADHSLVQEHVRSGEMTEEQARGSRFKNVITRAIGIARSVDPDIEIVHLQSGDTLLLCSDGLTNMVPEPQISWLLSDEDVSKACRRLVDAALANGGIDNITTVVVRFGPYDTAAAPVARPVEDAAPIPVLQRPRTEARRESGWLTPVLALLVICLGTALVWVGQETHEMIPSWPFVRHKPAPQPPPALAPALDYAKLAYADPEEVLDKPLRPAPIAVDPAGNVFVVAAGSGIVLRVTPEGRYSRFVASDAAPKVARASKHWTTDPQGNLYVSSFADKKIAKYDPKGTRIGTLGVGKLKSPEDIAVDAKGHVYVIDEGRLIVFRATAPNSSNATR